MNIITFLMWSGKFMDSLECFINTMFNLTRMAIILIYTNIILMAFVSFWLKVYDQSILIHFSVSVVIYFGCTVIVSVWGLLLSGLLQVQHHGQQSHHTSAWNLFPSCTNMFLSASQQLYKLYKCIQATGHACVSSMRNLWCSLSSECWEDSAFHTNLDSSSWTSLGRCDKSYLVLSASIVKCVCITLSLSSWFWACYYIKLHKLCCLALTHHLFRNDLENPESQLHHRLRKIF